MNLRKNVRYLARNPENKVLGYLDLPLYTERFKSLKHIPDEHMARERAAPGFPVFIKSRSSRRTSP